MDRSDPKSARPVLKSLLRPFGTSIFGEMTRLAQAHGAINLSQGFPDFDGPRPLLEAAASAILAGPNQYARSQGHLPLVRAIAEKVERWYGVPLDPLTEVGVTSGATEAIFASMMGLLEPGDEVICFEPFYDSYPASIRMAGGIPVCCPLVWPEFSVDLAQLERLISPRTRAILLNTPHNPTGRVFSRSELEGVATLAIRHDLLVVADEVYEHLTYDGMAHIPMATLPGMSGRTLTISSTGKTFSLTGWKIGYAWGPAPLVGAMQAAHQFITFATATPLQEAMSLALRSPQEVYEELQTAYQVRRDFLLGALESAGFQPRRPEGTYFIMADFSRLGFTDDVACARFLTAEAGVACIPPSFFYAEGVQDGRHLVRFAFCKKLETLQAAALRLERLPDLLGRCWA